MPPASSVKKTKKTTRTLSPALKVWNKVVKDHGYMVKGSFKKVPKKGTKAYAAILADYNKAKEEAGIQ